MHIPIRYGTAETPAPSFTRRIRQSDFRERNTEAVRDALAKAGGIDLERVNRRLDRLTDLELAELSRVLCVVCL